MAHRGVEYPPAVIFIGPGHRVKFSHTVFGIVGSFIRRDQDFYIRIEIFEGINLVGPNPLFRKVIGCGMLTVDDVQLQGLLMRVVEKLRSNKLGIPRPFVLCIGSAVDADDAISSLDKTLDHGFLLVIKNRPGGTHHDHDIIALQVFVSDIAFVLGSVNIKYLVPGEFF